jgi:altronate dehydratase large subunit
MNFDGYRRIDGQVGTRNHVLVIPSVGCSQGCAQGIARGFKGAVFLPNILGCGQVGIDKVFVKRTLVGFGRNPNVSAVLIVGNGCEHLSPQEILKEITPTGKRVEVVIIQEEGGTKKTIALGRKIVKDMLREAQGAAREPVPLSELVLGTECGGSDYTSGLASNPAVGIASDMIVAEGGTVILSETPEIVGAEHLLAKRARTAEVGGQILSAVDWWEKQAIDAGQDIREANPSPGNKAGGITTLEEKSLGCIHKAGTGRVEEVIQYAEKPRRNGLVFMNTPAHDIEQLTGMVAGGAQVVVFTTGRGNPSGSPVAPVIKITANRNTFVSLRDNMDMDVSRILRGRETVAQAGRRIFNEIVAVASGKVTKAERLGQRDFAIFKIYPNI